MIKIIQQTSIEVVIVKRFILVVIFEAQSRKILIQLCRKQTVFNDKVS